MADDRRLGKWLTWVLRHEPEAVGIELDPGGWTTIDGILRVRAGLDRAISRADFDHCVGTDSKQRFTISADGERVRAAQGHSVSVDLGLIAREPPARLYHGTTERFVPAILELGIERRARHAVHLSVGWDTAVEVGRRRGRVTVLRVDAAKMHRDGHSFHRSDNGVWLTSHVPAAYLSVQPTELADAPLSRHESGVPEELTLDLPDLQISARAWGPPDGQPVLALHGWLDNAATHDRLAPLLCARAGLRIVCLDLPGHGLSDRKRGPYHFIDWVADTLDAANALGWDRFSLLGHSMGAGVSVMVAGTVPDRIERCLLLEGIGPIVDSAERAPQRLARSLALEAKKRPSKKRVYPSKDIAADRISQVANMELSSARVLVERGLEAVEGGWVWRADPRLRVDSRFRLSEAQVLAYLGAITCPTILVRALQGWPVDVEWHGRRVDAVSDLELIELDGGHHLHLDQPELVADQLVAWLERRS